MSANGKRRDSELKTLNRVQAVAVVFEFAVNFAIQKARAVAEDALNDQPNDKLDYWELSKLYRKVRESLHEMSTFYCYSMHDIDYDRFVAARWALGEDYVNARIAEILKTFTEQTIESLVVGKLAIKRAEAKRENVDDWIAIE